MLAAVLAKPRNSHGPSLEHPFRQRRDLLADQDTQQPNQSDHGRGWRANVQEAVNGADEKADSETDEISFHGQTPATGTGHKNGPQGWRDGPIRRRTTRRPSCRRRPAPGAFRASP